MTNSIMQQIIISFQGFRAFVNGYIFLFLRKKFNFTAKYSDLLLFFKIMS